MTPRDSAATGVRDAARRELIGLGVTVVDSGDPTLVGLEGRVVDETRRTFVIERRGPDGVAREATVAKRGQSFAFEMDGARVVLVGDALNFAPEDRIKKTR